jgi:ankyrin repeat protein
MVACIGELPNNGDRAHLRDQSFGWLLTDLLPELGSGHLEAARVLIKAGADVLHDHSGFSAVHLAAACGPLELVQEMMPLPSVQLEQYASHGGYTPLLTAAFMGQETIVEWLVKKGANVMETHSDSGETALHMAANLKNGASCRVLLDAGADVNAEAKHKATPLHEAVMLLKGQAGKDQEVSRRKVKRYCQKCYCCFWLASSQMFLAPVLVAVEVLCSVS